MNILKQRIISRRGFRYGGALQISFIHSSQDKVLEVCFQEQEVVIALGSNVGDRLQNFNEALQLMRKAGIHITRHACLYETAPAYVTNQPQFLNSAVRAVTKLGPHELLSSVKNIEKQLGRTAGIRYGPRLIDLDILLYGRYKVHSDILTVPHERIWERPFVLAPLIDLLGSDVDTDVVACWHALAADHGGLFESWEKVGGESLTGKEGMRRVFPIGNSLWDWSCKTFVMGVPNLTPDSSSDGGKFQSIEAVVSQVRLMVSDGVDIIDIGAQSTRPMAPIISVEEELDQLVPVLEAVAAMPEMSGKFISVDTFYSKVALEAVKRGVHIVNDISAGQLDPQMHRVVADLNVPYIAMHMRGDPSTMQNNENLQYDDVCNQIASELHSRIRDAESSGIPAWRIIVDPGIGFSKNTKQNLDILTGVPKIRAAIARRSLGLSHAPMLIGPSRKKFLGEVCLRSVAAERDPATVAAVTVGVLGGSNIIRVHNVRDNLDAVRLCDAMLKREKELKHGFGNACVRPSITQTYTRRGKKGNSSGEIS